MTKIFLFLKNSVEFLGNSKKCIYLQNTYFFKSIIPNILVLIIISILTFMVFENNGELFSQGLNRTMSFKLKKFQLMSNNRSETRSITSRRNGLRLIHIPCCWLNLMELCIFCGLYFISQYRLYTVLL